MTELASPVPLRTSDIAAAAGGSLHGDVVVVTGASTDSRAIQRGQLYVAVRGDRDGHDFLKAASKAGAAAYLSDGETIRKGTGIVVPDTVKAMADVAALVRSKLTAAVYGITGSVGKTTTKDFLASILRGVELSTASARSFNNEIGVPLTLINTPANADSVVLEMGARHLGNIAYLCEFARPHIGIVTNVGMAHVGQFGGIEQIVQTKGELIESLPSSGTAVLNVNDDNVLGMRRRTDAHVLTYGIKAGDVYATDVQIDNLLRASFRLHTPAGELPVFLKVFGAQMVPNALAAAAAATASGVDLPSIVTGLEQAQLSPQRMAITTTASGATLIDDTYNANPSSVRAALQALERLPVQGRRIAVLGVMAELGDVSPSQHEAIAELADDMHVELITFDAPEYGVSTNASIEEALAAIGSLSPNDALLVKGSRIARLERVVEALR